MKTFVNAQTELEAEIRSQVVGTVRVLGDKRFTLGFAESCTGGLLSSFITELAGVSQVFKGAIVSYDNRVKQSLLKVSDSVLKAKGAVSFETAKQMAEEAVKVLDVSVAVSVTGIAGPSGGSVEKPVGTVFIAVAGTGVEAQVFEHHFSGDRKLVQLQTCREAIKHLNEFINK